MGPFFEAGLHKILTNTLNTLLYSLISLPYSFHMSHLNTFAALAATVALTTGCDTLGRAGKWVNTIGKSTCDSVLEDVGDEARNVYGKTDTPDRDACLEGLEPLAAVQMLNREAQTICTDSVSKDASQRIQNGVNEAFYRSCGAFMSSK